LRGGSWDDNNADDFRCDTRLWSAPDNRTNFRGFRLARS